MNNQSGPFSSAPTPRGRFEIEAPRLLQSRRDVPLVQLQTTFTTILTARADAYFLFDQLFVAEVNSAVNSFKLCLVAPAGSATAANAVAWIVPILANSTDVVIGGLGLLVPPGYTVQASANSANHVNIFGWGWDIIGDAAP